MKNKLMLMEDKLLLRKRGLVESVGTLKIFLILNMLGIGVEQTFLIIFF